MAAFLSVREDAHSVNESVNEQSTTVTRAQSTSLNEVTSREQELRSTSRMRKNNKSEAVKLRVPNFQQVEHKKNPLPPGLFDTIKY